PSVAEPKWVNDLLLELPGWSPFSSPFSPAFLTSIQVETRTTFTVSGFQFDLKMEEHFSDQ
ncbi:unnamed protein product, partial [Symbiodinium pilosum]